MKVLNRWGREIACEEFHLILHLLSNLPDSMKG
jgi:hypothetical protein